MLNYKLVIVSFCIFLGAILYLFYWNRLLAFLIGSIFRFLLWDKGESSIWFDIGSIQFSILGGKIHFKDLRYHSSNQSIRIVKGHISWRYWIRVPASQEDLLRARILNSDLGPTPGQKSELSCRLHASLQGLEWFIYNRTAAYENIISSLDPNMAPTGAQPAGGGYEGEAPGNLRKIFSWSSAVPDSTHLGPPVSFISSLYSRTPKFVKNLLAWGKRQLPQLDPKDLLPLGLEVDKAAIICGNDSTPSLLVAEFRRARGSYGIVPSRSKLDLYKQLLNLTFHNPSIHYAENENYKEPMRNSGEKLLDRIQSAKGEHPLHPLAYLPFSPFSTLWKKLKLWNPIPLRLRGRSVITHTAAQASSWRKKTKKTDEETPVGGDFSTIEYAKEPKILEAPILELLYYADVVGLVPDGSQRSCTAGDAGGDPLDIGNGDLPPEWGMDLAIRGGFLRYGPWADRQRAVLQQAFFPSNFAEVVPQPCLKPGDSRVWPCMKILVELRDGVMLQIPFRETSKDWQWDREVELPYPRPRKREPASIHIRAGDNSTISYMMPMIATSKGYEPVLNVHLDTVTVTSSLNDIRLITAESCVVRCDLPSPLKWNAQRKWAYNISLRNPVLYLLRDHINMFTDLGRDWASGPPSDYNRFIPMIYALEVELQNYELNTYVNDHNIIDKPSILEENALLTLCGRRLKSEVWIPFAKYRPDSTAVSFCFEAPSLDVSLTLPRWNTRSLYSTPHRSGLIGHIGWLRLDASYRYFTDVCPENIDQLNLDISARDVIYKACGWTIRYFMVLRNNYFGSFTHFTTLYEYINKRKLGLPLGDPVDAQYREGSSNAMQVQMGVSVQNGLLILPCGLPGYEIEHESREKDSCDIGTCLMLSLPELQLQLRTHDYYMEMSLNVDCLSGTIHKHCSENLHLARLRLAAAKEKFVLDGLDIVAHRLFGPQPFTTTYLCIWEIHLESLRGSLDVSDIQILGAVGRAFGLGFIDPLNAPATEYEVPVDPDVTFVKISLDTLNLVWNAGSAAVELSLPYGLRFDSNDVAGERYSKLNSIRIPEVSAKMFLANQANSNTWHEVMTITGDSNVDMYFAPPDWQEKARAQREFLAKHDSATKRATFLYLQDKLPHHDRIGSGRTSELSTEFYLPQLRIPKFSATRGFANRAPAGNSKPSGSVGPHPPIEYDSEGEGVISETERDARLANSRPTILALSGGSDDGNMTSGDESDNEDLTGPHQSESDISDIFKEADPHQWPSVEDYSRFSRCYKSRHLDRPSFWAFSPFYLSRSRKFEPSTQFTHNSGEENVPLSGLQLHHDFDRSVDTSIIRVDSSQGITIWLTPLILPATQHLIRNINSSQLSPELRLDTIIADRIQSLSSTPPKSSATVLDVNLASLSLCCVQLIPKLDWDSDKSEEPPISTGHTGKESSTSSIGLVSRGISIRHRQLKGEVFAAAPSSLCASFNLFGLSFMKDTDNLEVPLSCTAGLSSFSINGPTVVVSLGDTQVEMMPTMPSAAMGVALFLNRFISGLRSAYDNHVESANAPDEYVIYRAIQLARMKNIQAVDPLSTTQPSYLVQKGLPNDMRTDTAFKYLIYLRMCLQFLDEPERLSLVTLEPPDFSLRDVRSALANELRHFAEDTQHLMNPRPSIFHQIDDPSPVDQAQLSPFLIGGDVSLKLSCFHLVLPHTENNLRSEFLVGPLVVSTLLRLSESAQAPGLGPARSTTTLPVRDKASHDIEQIALAISVGDALLAVYPQLISFLQNTIRAARQCRSLIPISQTLPPPHQQNQSFFKQISTIYADVVITTRSLRFKAGAENLLVEYRATDVGYASAILLTPPSSHRPTWDTSTNHSLAFGELKLQACAVADLATRQEFSVLASIAVGGGRVNVLHRQEHQTSTLRITLGLEFVRFSVPRSAIRLYRFMEEWKADYLPGIDATIRSLLSELKKNPGKTRSLSSRASDQHAPLALQIQAGITSIRVSLQVMRGTWLSWEIDQSIAHFTAPSATRKTRTKNFGLRIGSQTFSVSSRAHYHDTTSDVRVKLALPAISVTGRHDGKQIQSYALVEFFRWTVKPMHWDTLLAVQQKSGQDFNDLLSLIAESSRKSSGNSKAAESVPITAPWGYQVQVKMKGFQIGLEGLASTLLLECDHIGGVVSKSIGLKWHVELSDLALSLASHNRARTMNSTLYRDHRAAFVIIDLRVDMSGGAPSKNTHAFNVSVTKIHAVMQPSSIGQLGDFVDHLQAEVLARKEKRAQDLAEFKEKTRNLLRTLEVANSDPQAQDSPWLDQYVIRIKIKNVGVAFPLALNRDLQMPRAGNQHDEAVRAFLLSIKSISFGFERGESGQAAMKGFSFQFVSRFRQSTSQDFSGENHPTRNRLLYPEMTAQLRSDRINGVRRTRIMADVDGFILDVDSSIPDNISSLIEVYRQGKDRVDKLAAALPREASTSDSVALAEISPIESSHDILPSSNIFLFLTFRSGRVRMYSQASAQASRTRTLSQPLHEANDDQIRELGAEVFKLPVVSVWGEYRAAYIFDKHKGVATEPSTLLFKSTVHSSQNTLRPTLLPFLTEVISNIEAHMRKANLRESRSRPSSAVSPPAPTDPYSSTMPEELSSQPGDSVPTLQISLSLRIDQSKLELTCQPDVNVIAGLNWDSGGFVVNISPGARRVTFTGSVGGITAGLKHGFLSEDCVRLRAKDLAFTVNLSKSLESNMSSVSVVCDTEFSGGVRFSRLQDILCFKAVWLDRIPVFSVQPITPVTPRPKSAIPITPSVSLQQPKQEFATALLLRLREVSLDVDLGQSISSMHLNLSNSVLRTKITEIASEVSLSVRELNTVATGNLAGHLTVPDFVFRTIRRTTHSRDDVSKDRMLDLYMTSGPLDIELESEYQRLLLYRAEPLIVTIYDDWSLFKPGVPVADRRVRLTFNVIGSSLMAVMNVGTIPKLVSYGNKFNVNLENQREGAARESQAFRMSSSPKPDNPLSEVANAMFISARSKFVESEPGILCVVSQRLSLRLKTLRLVIFPRSMRDPELAQFVGTDVHARLDRLVKSDVLPPERDLHLSFSSIAISKLSQLNHILVSKEKAADSHMWFTLLTKDALEATIFSLPSMDMRMHSDEFLQDNGRVLPYDFSSKFTTKQGPRDTEDIYITLNMSLYSWLTILRRTFAREMEQSQAAAEVRAPTTGVVQPTARQRKATHVPDPLVLDHDADSPRPHLYDSPEPWSPPPSAKRIAIQHTKSLPPRNHDISPLSTGFTSPANSTAFQSPVSPINARLLSPAGPSPVDESVAVSTSPGGLPSAKKAAGMIYQPRDRHIERLTMRQLGEATPDVMHPFFMKTAGFNLEDSLPQFVHEYATMPTEEIMKALLKLYSKQLKIEDVPGSKRHSDEPISGLPA